MKNINIKTILYVAITFIVIATWLVESPNDKIKRINSVKCFLSIELPKNSKHIYVLTGAKNANNVIFSKWQSDNKNINAIMLQLKAKGWKKVKDEQSLDGSHIIHIFENNECYYSVTDFIETNKWGESIVGK